MSHIEEGLMIGRMIVLSSVIKSAMFVPGLCLSFVNISAQNYNLL
jgi:hypothetical protein